MSTLKLPISIQRKRIAEVGLPLLADSKSAESATTNAAPTMSEAMAPAAGLGSLAPKSPVTTKPSSGRAIISQRGSMNRFWF